MSTSAQSALAAPSSVRDLRVLMIAFASTAHGGVHRKLGEQVREMRRHIPETTALVFCDTREAPAPLDPPYTVVDLAGGGFDADSRPSAWRICTEAVARCAPDVVYVRYPLYDEHVLRFVREAPPVVFELQTKFDLELPVAMAEIERAWARRILPETAGLVAVTPEILAHELTRGGVSLPQHVMSNGADPELLPFVAPQLPADRVNLVCVASFYPWHGADRVICGMAAEPEVNDVHLHLVGDGGALPALRSLSADLGVADRVHFHGLIAADTLDPFYRQAHLAIGVLAPQRKGLTELSALKHREYALRGLPFVAAGIDIDFPSTLPWMRSVDASDAPLSPRTLRAFALSWTHERRRRQIRQWAEQHLSWDAKIRALTEFLGTVARHRAKAA